MSVIYQLHSTNDLREWNSFFRKGATSLKIDPHFVNTTPALLLSHDKPILGVQAYSSLADVLSYLKAAPSFIHGKDIDIALCFKSAPKELCVDETSKDVVKWNSMVDDFFIQAAEVVQQVKEDFDITLTFVLDGDGKPCDCKANRWLPWISVWIVKDEFSLQCYNSTEGFCKRFTILNDPDTSDWAAMATQANHYGKFGSGNHPLQLWEPDSQAQIANFVNGYVTGQAKGVPSGGGLAFAINVDIPMFDTFTSRTLTGVNARGFNVVVEDGDPTGPLRATDPKLVYDSPNELTLQYWISITAIKRKLTMSPFTSLQVGLPEEDEVEALGGIDPPYEPRNPRNEYRENILEHLGDLPVASTSLQEVGELSFIFVSVGGKVYGASKRSDELAFTNFRLIGLGSSVHASSLDSTLLLVTEGNHCYNSHIHNTRAFPLVCDPKTAREDACEYALDYSVGTAENWSLWLEQQPDAVLTPCNEFILHGTFSGGQNPSGALFPLDAKSQAEGKVGVMVAHEPYPLFVESKCGTPYVGDTGIVVSAFASFVVTDRFVGQDDGGRGEFDHFVRVLKILVGVVLGLVGYWLSYLYRRKRTQEARQAKVSTYFPESQREEHERDGGALLLREL
mmetsp:Transcript_26686/g.44747  ORF Transcript_26686/g.44747 Transcript_26686/m.44747 type:complete len:622 (+) Transcript_26686:287-2152(+)|eukprot:CAMPEP_0198199282 /NCGR_PEP_ID=MMETSP1445-20131203/2594_1 /TAXON_ID=36898 /ORGANISM="Pyramimonas sp., Strain CCMP2087" /LENGTH=621 /DNA_ID=CAMNT_0043869075 /DNA_START=274 /DNA_END=2139 /DNA_ORIENTATION=-